MDENNSVPEMTMEERVHKAIEEMELDGTYSFSQYGSDSFVYIVINPECVREKEQIDNLVETILSGVPNLDRKNEFFSEPGFRSYSGFYWSMQFSLWKTWKEKDSVDVPYARSGIIRVSIIPDPEIPRANRYICSTTSMWKKVMEYFNK